MRVWARGTRSTQFQGYSLLYSVPRTQLRQTMMKESLYVMASIAVFAVIGMLTGYLHGHGEIAALFAAV